MIPHTGIGTVTSDYGSKRYLLSYEGDILAGLQVVSQDGVHATIANVYTRPAYRRKGLGRILLAAAKQDYETVTHSKHLSEEGAAWAKGVENKLPLVETVRVSDLYAWTPKAVEALQQVKDGKLSFSPGDPMIGSKLDKRGAWFVMDGHHRALEAILRGDKTIEVEHSEHLPYIERTGGAYSHILSDLVRLIDVIPSSKGSLGREVVFDEVFAWLDWDDFDAAVDAGIMAAGTSVVEDPGDGPLALRNGRRCLKVKGPARVKSTANQHFETLEPLSLEKAEFWTVELDPQWEALSELDDEWPEPSELDIEAGAIAYHGAPARLRDQILEEGLNPPDREELFFSDSLWIPKSFARGGGVVFAFPWPERWQERWLAEDLHGGDFWTLDPIPPEKLEIVYEE